MHTKIDHIPKRYRYIVGIDEAGRGPLAGPCTVGLVMIPRRDIEQVASALSNVRDSKRLSPGKRQAVLEQAWDFEYGGQLIARTVSNASYSIDQTGISRCIRQSIEEGLEELVAFAGVNPQSVFVYLDGALKAPARYRQQTVIRGDSKVFAIALASIYAKVTRDLVMEQYDIRYPSYGFYAHKGYGTTEHTKAIKKYGPCPIHRQSYLKKILPTATPVCV